MYVSSLSSSSSCSNSGSPHRPLSHPVPSTPHQLPHSLVTCYLFTFSCLIGHPFWNYIFCILQKCNLNSMPQLFHIQSLLSFQLPMTKVLTCLDLKLLTFQMLSLLASEAEISPSFYTLWSHQMSQNGPGSGPPGLHVWHPVLSNNSISSDFMQTESIKKVTLEQITTRYLKNVFWGQYWPLLEWFTFWFPGKPFHCHFYASYTCL